MIAAEAQEQYLKLAPHLSRFAELGSMRLQELLTADTLALASPVQSRVKTLESVLDKIGRKGDVYSDLKSLPDLVGFRLVVAYRRELEHACQVVEDAFRVDIREDAGLSPDRFGYSSTHLRVRAPYEWRHEDQRMLLSASVSSLTKPAV